MDDQNPYAAPQVDLEPVAEINPADIQPPYRVGNRLYVEEHATLPQRCVCCNQPAERVLTLWQQKQSTSAKTATFVAIAIVVAYTSFASHFIRNHLGGWYFPLLMLLLFASTYGARKYRFTGFKFYLCPRHQTIRRIGSGLLWGGMAMFLLFTSSDLIFAFVLSPWLLLPVLAVITVGLVMAYWPGARPISRLRKGPYEFVGFGKEYLDSFPGRD